MIQRADGKSKVIVKDGDTEDIIRVLVSTVPEVTEQTKVFARQFVKSKEGLYDLWEWVHTNIRYKEDPLGVQWIREPRRLYSDREGDCKSYTVFIVSVLQNMGIPWMIRFVNTERPNSKEVNHVYPIAILNGNQIPMDAISKAKFNWEPKRFHKIDYNMTEIHRLSGIGATANTDEQAILQYAKEVERLAADIPDEILNDDITKMTQGQFSRFLAARKYSALADNARGAQGQRAGTIAEALRSGNLAGISGTQADVLEVQRFLNQTAMQTGPAFVAPVIEIPGLSGLGSIKSRIKDIAENIKDAWRKVINFAFKTALPLAAPFFLLIFAKKKLKKKAAARQAKQRKILNWITETGKFENAAAVTEALKTGIAKKFGKQPEQILDAAASKKVSGQVGAVVAIATAAMSAIQVIVDLIGKISKLFKKNKVDADASAATDINEFAAEGYDEETTNSGVSKENATNKGGSKNIDFKPKEGKTGVMQYIPYAAVAVGIYLATR